MSAKYFPWIYRDFQITQVTPADCQSRIGNLFHGEGNVRLNCVWY